jgi:hypothetical protein
MQKAVSERVQGLIVISQSDAYLSVSAGSEFLLHLDFSGACSCCIAAVAAPLKRCPATK